MVSTQHVDGPLYVDMVRWVHLCASTNVRVFCESPPPEKTSFFINDQVFDENRTDVTVKLGDTEKWTILNKDLASTRLSYSSDQISGYGSKRRPMDFDGLHDAFSVPPERNGRPGEAKLIIPFTNPEIVGRFVFHCHVVKHEDKGMMMTVEVLP